ncbi:Aldo/keto reductase [Trichodelitschia bisporula]|uniref:Aldo/keto reductase n=1 Tax=Trichodelitschia bisporula TaxID=703511 RepID=A0A6G1HMC8_9PEZI|nr:Aldo/keto reductase [Trichodelitschia bisporula]
MANLNIRIPKLKLSDGAAVPLLAYGTGTAWYKRGDESQIDRDLVESIKIAIKLGYTHLDGAEVYKTEPELGLAIKESGVKREDLYVVTKVLPNIKDIEGALRNSLKKLQLDYVDLYLIHAPWFTDDDAGLQKAWADMEAVKAAGLTKSIGVSNYLVPHLEATLKTATSPPVINQIEFHPYLQRSELLAFHKTHNIATAAYGPLTAVTKGPGPLDGMLAALAKKYAVSEAEISLRWAMDQDVIAVTTSSKEQRLSDYLRAGAFKLNPEEIREINRVGQEKHFRGFWQAKFAADDRT